MSGAGRLLYRVFLVFGFDELREAVGFGFITVTFTTRPSFAYVVHSPVCSPAMK